jgi:heptaprenyl diphosphate synthase
MKGKLTTKRIALLGCFTAMALIIFVIENLLPSIILPGAKIGLSNIFTLLTLILLGPLEAVILIIARTVLGCLIVGNLSALMYSLSAGLVSVGVSILLYKISYERISIIAISISAAVIHNIVQNIVFCLITQTPKYFAYIGYLAIFGVVSGAMVGIIVLLLIKYIPLNFYEKVLGEIK